MRTEKKNKPKCGKIIKEGENQKGGGGKRKRDSGDC